MTSDNAVINELNEILVQKINEYGENEQFLNDSEFSYDLIYSAIEDDLYADIFDDDEKVNSLFDFFNMENISFADENNDEESIEEFFDNLTVFVVEYFNISSNKENIIK